MSTPKPVRSAPKRKILLIVILLLGGLTPACLISGGGSPGEKSDKVPEERKPQTAIIPADGGTLVFDNGVEMDFPSGAVPQDTEITIELLDNQEVKEILDQGAFPLEPLTFIKVSSDVQQLGKPVRVQLPVLTDEPLEGWPVPLSLDLDSGTVEYLTSKLVYDPEAKTVEYSVDQFSGTGVGSKSEKEDSKKCNDPGGACRCGRIYVKSSFHDYSIGDCQSVSDEVSVQFLDCPGQPTEKHKISEITGDCIAMGSLSFAGSVFVEGQEINLSCGGPVPFIIGGNNNILGGGPMQCSVRDDVEGIMIDIFVDEQVSLTGEFDGTNLNFDPPEAENISGHVRSWMMVEGEKFTIIDMVFNDQTASGEVVEFQGVTLLSFSTSTKGDPGDRSQFAFSIPLDTSGQSQIIIQEGGSKAILTITMELEY
jgi:hypothetical protein